MRGREVLKLVDKQVSGRRLRRAPGVRVAQEQFDRSIDLLIEVDQLAIAQDGAVPLERFHYAFRIWNGRLDRPWIGEAQPDRGQRGDVRRPDVGIRLGADLEETLEDPPYSALVDHLSVRACAQEGS